MTRDDLIIEFEEEGPDCQWNPLTSFGTKAGDRFIIGDRKVGANPVESAMYWKNQGRFIDYDDAEEVLMALKLALEFIALCVHQDEGAAGGGVN